MVGRRIVFGVVVLLAAVALWLSLRSGAVTEDAAEPDESADVSSRAKTGRQIDERPLAAGSWQGRRITGLVLDADTGAPIAGATVSLGEHEAYRHSRYQAGQVPRPRFALTGNDGRFAMQDLPPLGFVVGAGAPGYLGAREKLDLAGGDQEVTLRLTSGGHALTGRVTDVGGGGIPGTLVVATVLELSLAAFDNPEQTSAVTDDDGRYRLSLSPGTYTVAAWHPDYVEVTDTFTQGAQDGALDFVLTPGGRISGRVLSRADGAPIAGARVTWSGGQATGKSQGPPGMSFDADKQVMTDADGRFQTPPLGSGDIALSAYARGFVTREPVQVSLGLAEVQSDVTLWVDTGFSISGRVVEFENPETPIAGVHVGALRMQGFEPRMAPAPTGADGSYEIFGLVPSTYFLMTMGEGVVTNFATNMVGVVDRDVTGVELRVSRGVTVSGRVDPAGPAAIALEVDLGDSPSITGMMTVMSAAFVRGHAAPDGTFELVAVPRGKYRVMARTDDGRGGASSVEVATTSVTGVVVPLESWAVVEGTVVDPRGRPVGGVDVQLSPDQEDGVRIQVDAFMSQTTTDEQGRFVRRGLEAGTYDIRVSDDLGPLELVDDDDDESRVELDNGRTTRIRLKVQSQDGRIAGTVTDADGAPLPDAWVSATLEDSGGWARTRPALTDEGGAFELSGLREGSYRVQATGPGGRARASKSGARPGERVELRLLPTGVIAGQLTRKGQPVTEFALEVSGPSDRERRVSSPEGRFLLEGLESGDYELQAESEDGEGQTTATVTAGDTTSVTFELAGWGSLKGRLVDPEGAPVPRVHAIASEQNRTDVVAGFVGFGKSKTSSSGQFSLNRVRSGTGTVYFFDDKMGMVASHDYELDPGDALDLGDVVGVPPDHKSGEERGWLGWKLGDSPPGASGSGSGLWVTRVDDAGPARLAGVQTGDRIVAAGPHQVAVVGPDAVESFLERYQSPGEPVLVQLERAGETTAVTITPGARPD